MGYAGFVVGYALGVAWKIAIVMVLAYVLSSMARAHEQPVQITRWVDADTFDGVLDLGLGLSLDARFRLMCINAPEHDTATGQAMEARMARWAIERGTARILERDAFGRVLVFLRPDGWEETLNRRLYQIGAPLYGRLSRDMRAWCEEQLK